MNHKTQPVDIVDRAAEAMIRTSPAGEVPAHLTEAAVRLADEPAGRIRPRSMWRLAAAFAIVLTGAVIAALVLTQGGSSAFAQVVEKVRRIHTARYTATTTMQDKELKIKTYVMEPGRMRMEVGEAVSITDRAAGKAMTLIPTTKQAMLIDTPAQQPGPDMDFLGSIRTLDGDAGKLVAREKLGDINAAVYKAERGEMKMKLWIDPATDLPIRADFEFTKSVVGPIHVVLDEFAWDPPLDAKLFSMDVPAGYTVRKLEVKGTPEEQIADALRFYTQMSGGPLPDDLGPGVIAQLMKVIQERHPEKADSRELMEQAATKFGAGIGAAQGLSFSGQGFTYAGKGVKLNDPGKVIAWWKPRGSQTYRAIMADLSIKDLAASEVPATPANP